MKVSFDDQTIHIDSVFGPLSVTVTGEALHALRRDGAGPQDGPGLIAAHYETIVQVATMKFEADEGEDDYAVRITGIDLET
ncbi:hypothetical protein EAH79_02275 [Sphingomonas koreensis]|nr:hypothetical protein EAH79_02275 [Sphingomonas koreensis]